MSLKFRSRADPKKIYSKEESVQLYPSDYKILRAAFPSISFKASFSSWQRVPPTNELLLSETSGWEI